MDRRPTGGHTIDTDALVISRAWEELAWTGKYQRMLQRRNKILKSLPVFRRQLATLEKLLGEGRGVSGPLLEVACGMGFQLLELSARGWPELLGLEIDPELCRLTTDAARRFALDAGAVAGDACAIPLDDESCAAVFSHSFFEHVYDVDLALREQIRVLKPGGLLLIFDGNLFNPKTVADLLFFYPLRTRGRHGGFKWLFGKGKVHRNLYGYLPLGRDEDIQTPGWWQKRIRREPQLQLVRAVTGGAYTHPQLPSWLQRFVGSCVIVARKVGAQ
jgi:SAM-dependent methyltransferase